MSPRYDVVVPTAGRPSLPALLGALAEGDGPWPERIVVVDDRPGGSGGAPPDLVAPGALPAPVRERLLVVRGARRGPAAARNAGWRAGKAEWVAFLDDDVLPPPGWRALLAADLAGAAPEVAGVQGRIEVPLPAGRRPTDWERNVEGLARARWATADLAYRRAALAAAQGFDERFPRAYREDAELGLRLTAAGWRLERGVRPTVHPVGLAGFWVSVARQAGNADDALMRRLHGRGWRERAGAPPGRRPRHLAIAAAAAGTLGLAVARRPRAAALAGAVWLAGTGELALARILSGPLTPGEVAKMLATSAALPPAAAGWWVAGAIGHRRERPLAPAAPPAPAPPAAVLLDRDGTLIRDVPYNGDPARVQPMPGAREALDRLRARGVKLGVVSNQSGVGRGWITSEDVAAVNRRVEELLGPLGPWAVCPHGPEERCACRKPAPGLVLEAAAALGVAPERCVVVGDIGADVEAARAAGARAVLVPTPRTREEEVRAAPALALDLGGAVDLVLGDAR